jgi:hypothetical protein
MTKKMECRDSLFKLNKISQSQLRVKTKMTAKVNCDNNHCLIITTQMARVIPIPFNQMVFQDLEKTQCRNSDLFEIPPNSTPFEISSKLCFAVTLILQISCGSNK